MFKDYHKYLSTSLKIYTFLLVIIFIMKIVGLDYFGLDINNPVMIKLNNIVWHFKIREIWYIFTLWLYAYIILSVVSNNKKVKGVAHVELLTYQFKVCQVYQHQLHLQHRYQLHKQL